MTVVGCDTYCQSGAKYGTQCHSMNDVRTMPGQRPPLSNDPPLFYSGPPPPQPKPSAPPPVYPMPNPTSQPPNYAPPNYPASNRDAGSI